MADFSIIPLTEKTELVDACVAWSYGEWGSQVPTRNLMKVYEDYVESIKDEMLPMTWIAMVGEQPVGMARLKKNDHIEREDLKPWFSSLYVHPRYRGQGIAQALCAHVEKYAKEVYGYEEIYLFTGTAEKMYEKLGYEKIGTVTDRSGFHKDGEPLMRKKL